MLARLRLLKGATALLYFGPLLAGMSGFGFAMLVPFVAIFALWLMILRPEQWPSTAAEWLTAPAWGAAVTQVLSQVLLVTILFAVGRGIGGVAGFLPMTHPLFPLGVSVAAIPVSRMLWDTRRAAALGVFLDDEAEAGQAPHAAAEAANAVQPLLRLADDAPEQAVRMAIDDTLSDPAAVLRLEAIVAGLARQDRSHTALRRAMVIWATEPEIVAPGYFPDVAAVAFAITNKNPDLLRLFLPRAIALVAAFPDRAATFPSPDSLRQAAAAELDSGPNTDLPADLRADLQDGLNALARSVETALLQPRQSQDAPRSEPISQRAPRPA